MMTVTLQIFIAVIDILGLGYVLNLVRKHKVDLKYALSWFTVSVFVLVMDIFPASMEALADFLGVADPVNMIFLLMHQPSISI